MKQPTVRCTLASSAGRPDTVRPNSASAAPVAAPRTSAQAAEISVLDVTLLSRANLRKLAQSTAAIEACTVSRSGAASPLSFCSGSNRACTSCSVSRQKLRALSLSCLANQAT